MYTASKKANKWLSGVPKNLSHCTGHLTHFNEVNKSWQTFNIPYIHANQAKKWPVSCLLLSFAFNLPGQILALSLPGFYFTDWHIHLFVFFTTKLLSNLLFIHMHWHFNIIGPAILQHTIGMIIKYSVFSYCLPHLARSCKCGGPCCRPNSRAY